MDYAQDEKCRNWGTQTITEETDQGGHLLKTLSSACYQQKVCRIILELREIAELRQKAKKLRPKRWVV